MKIPQANDQAAQMSGQVKPGWERLQIQKLLDQSQCPPTGWHAACTDEVAQELKRKGDQLGILFNGVFGKNPPFMQTPETGSAESRKCCSKKKTPYRISFRIPLETILGWAPVPPPASYQKAPLRSRLSNPIRYA